MSLSNAKILELVTEFAAPIAEKHGLMLWDVEYVREGGQRYLRVFVDSSNGVTIDQCEAVSHELDPLLDEADPIDEPYTFEVSSAGAERALKRPSDFERFMGSDVAVKLYSARDGRKEHVGRLLSYTDGDVDIETAGRRISFKKSEMASVRLRIKF